MRRGMWAIRATYLPPLRRTYHPHTGPATASLLQPWYKPVKKKWDEGVWCGLNAWVQQDPTHSGSLRERLLKRYPRDIAVDLTAFQLKVSPLRAITYISCSSYVGNNLKKNPWAQAKRLIPWWVCGRPCLIKKIQPSIEYPGISQNVTVVPQNIIILKRIFSVHDYAVKYRLLCSKHLPWKALFVVNVWTMLLTVQTKYLSVRSWTKVQQRNPFGTFIFFNLLTFNKEHTRFSLKLPLWCCSHQPYLQRDWREEGNQKINDTMKLFENLSTNEARNVILFIADGNGINTNYGTRLYKGQLEGGYGDEYILAHEKWGLRVTMFRVWTNSRYSVSCSHVGQVKRSTNHTDHIWPFTIVSLNLYIGTRFGNRLCRGPSLICTLFLNRPCRGQLIYTSSWSRLCKGQIL